MWTHTLSNVSAVVTYTYRSICLKNKLVGWLVGWILMHINLYRLFNTKSILMKIVLFQTIQFSLSTQFKFKYSLIVKNIYISSYSA